MIRSLLYFWAVSVRRFENQDAALAEARRFVAATKLEYGLPRAVAVEAADMPLGWGAGWRDGNLYINRAALLHADLIAILAHEMGHLTLGDSRRQSHGTYDGQERLANVKAVEVLERVEGLPRDAALRIMCDYLYTAEVELRKLSHSVTIPQGHIRPADELRDLVAAFPEQHEIAITWPSVADCMGAEIATARQLPPAAP
jgi:hypothetical protein